MNTKFRPCESCHACCSGILSGNTYGNKYGNSKPCVFLVNKLCSIYNDRPNSCHKYQCAWSQNLLPEWMRPDKCGLLVSVEIDSNNQQYLKVVEMKFPIDYDSYNEIQKFCDSNNTYYVKVNYESKDSNDARL